MTTPRHHLLTMLILSLAACSTQDLDGTGFFRQLQPDDDLIEMVGSIRAPVGNLRIKVDGQFLISGFVDGKFVYAEIQGGLLSSATVPAGAPIDLVNGAGQTLLHIEPVVSSAITHTLLWVYDSPTGLVAEVPDLVPDDDDTTVEVRAVNVTVAERVIVSRCVGVFTCETCETSPDKGVGEVGRDFDISACEALTTIGPGQEWTSKPEPTNVPVGGIGSACLALQREGLDFGPLCAVELNRPSPRFQERSHVFIDGLYAISPVLPQGLDFPYFSGFVVGNEF
jgi:hypothetical protein